MVENVKRKDCPVCNGWGYRKVVWTTRRIECNACEGTGLKAERKSKIEQTIVEEDPRQKLDYVIQNEMEKLLKDE